MFEEQMPNYYGIIPANVRYDKDLRANAKLLYSELTCLTTKEGYCFASNNYFAKLYDVDPSAISKWIKQLSDKGYISVDYIYNGKECKERRITLNPQIERKNDDVINENSENVVTKNNTSIATSSRGVLPKEHQGIATSSRGYCQKNKDNNTSINITRDNNTSINIINLENEKSQKKHEPESIELTQYLFDECKKDNPNFKKSQKELDRWTEAFEKLNRIDNYEYSEIKRVLQWAKTDSFWRQNILSGVRFREKFEQLYVKSKNPGNNKKSALASCDQVKDDTVIF